MYIDKTMEIVKRIRNGEKVQCPLCKKGQIQPIGDRQYTTIFSCDNSKKTLHLNKRIS